MFIVCRKIVHTFFHLSIAAYHTSEYIDDIRVLRLNQYFAFSTVHPQNRFCHIIKVTFAHTKPFFSYRRLGTVNYQNANYFLAM